MVHLYPTPMRSRADSSGREASSYDLHNRLSAAEFCIESATLTGQKARPDPQVIFIQKRYIYPKVDGCGFELHRINQS